MPRKVQSLTDLPENVQSGIWGSIVAHARDGDADASACVLLKFAESPTEPEFALYVAECIRRWAKADFNRLQARSAFGLARKKGRRESPHAFEHELRAVQLFIDALRRFPEARAREHVEDQLSVSSAFVKRAVAGLTDPSKPFTDTQLFAIELELHSGGSRQQIRSRLGETLWDKYEKWRRERKAVVQKALAARFGSTRK